MTIYDKHRQSEEYQISEVRYDRKRIFNASQVSGYAYQFQNSAGEALNDLATSASSVLTGMPRNPNKATSKMADAVCKIVDLQAEINHDIDELVDLKKEISSTIKAVPSPELQTLLEKRYLCFQSWEIIAVDMGYSMHHLY